LMPALLILRALKECWHGLRLSNASGQCDYAGHESWKRVGVQPTSVHHSGVERSMLARER
jgi:hypothetical protein